MQTTIAGLNVLTAQPTNPATKPPLLFVHGLWGGAWNWENYLGFFAERGYPAYALDLRGHSGSKPMPDISKISIQDYITDVRVVAEELGNPVLVGHSMGGLLVQKLAELRQSPAAILINPAAPRGIFAVRTGPLLKTSLRHLPEFLLGRPLLPNFAEAQELLLNNLSLDQQQQLFARFVPEPGRLILEIALLGLPVNAQNITSPLLVIGCSADNITPVAMVRKIAQKYRAEMWECPGFAHMCLLEPGWERIATNICDWLDAAIVSHRNY